MIGNPARKLDWAGWLLVAVTFGGLVAAMWLDRCGLR